MFAERAWLDAGGMISFGANISDLYRRSADLVEKILHGTKPADIPVEQPTKFDLVVNLITAKVASLDRLSHYSITSVARTRKVSGMA